LSDDHSIAVHNLEECVGLSPKKKN